MVYFVSVPIIAALAAALCGDERELLFVGSGREAGDPYFEYLYALDLETWAVILLVASSVLWLVELEKVAVKNGRKR